MRNIILAIGALALLTASSAFADPASQTIGSDDQAVSLATGGGAGSANGVVMGMGQYIIGDDDMSFSLAGDAGFGTGAPVIGMLPEFALERRKTIGNDDRAFSSMNAGS